MCVHGPIVGSSVCIAVRADPVFDVAFSFVISVVLNEVPSFVLFVVVWSVVVYVCISISLLRIRFVLSLSFSSFLTLVLTLPLHS